MPNTTHVTQVTDQNYGPFKRVYRSNLTWLTIYRQQQIQKQSLGVFDILLLMFGGLVDGINIGLQYGIALAFSIKGNQEVWDKIGINPSTQNCLLSNMVKHEVVILVDGAYDVDADLLTSTLIALENQNMSPVDYLNKIGYDGGKFRKTAPKIDLSKKQLAVTEPRSCERQDLLVEQHTAGGQFMVTAGSPLNEDDAFIRWERVKGKNLERCWKKRKRNMLRQYEQKQKQYELLKFLQMKRRKMYSTITMFHF